MRTDQVHRIRSIADAVLYEGYMLYPYRPSNAKKRQRWTPGGLYPRSYAERNGTPSRLHAEVLVQPSDHLVLEIHVRFLHLLAEERRGRMWQRAVEREVVLSEVELEGRYSKGFSFTALEDKEACATRRRQRIDGLVDVVSGPVEAGLHKLSLRVTNTTEFRGPIEVPWEEASMQALVAAHAILHAPGGGFISLLDPPEQYREAASHCVNQRACPVLAGNRGSTEWMLAAPFILPDYPQLAAQSPGDFFEAKEEKMNRSDPRPRELAQRLGDPRVLVTSSGR
jgi:hypothetical protein